MLCNRGYLCNFGYDKQMKSFGEGVDPGQMEDELVGEMSELATTLQGQDKAQLEQAIQHVKQACHQLKNMSPAQKAQMMNEAKMMVKNEVMQKNSGALKEGYRYGGYRYNRYYPWRHHYYRNPYYTYYARPYYSYYSPHYYGYPYGPSYGYGYYW